MFRYDNNVYPVFEKDGEDYVADTRSVLTSNPPQYNAYRLKDRKITYISCHAINNIKYTIDRRDFDDFMTGKWDAPVEEIKEERFTETERLDWVIKNRALVHTVDGLYSVVTTICSSSDGKSYKTPREAINAAMEDK